MLLLPVSKNMDLFGSSYKYISEKAVVHFHIMTVVMDSVEGYGVAPSDDACEIIVRLLVTDFEVLIQMLGLLCAVLLLGPINVGGIEHFLLVVVVGASVKTELTETSPLDVEDTIIRDKVLLPVEANVICMEDVVLF